MKEDDCSDLTCIHRKMFDDPGVSGSGTLVHIYYKYCHKTHNIYVQDYSIHFMIDGTIGANIANNQDVIGDDLYRHLFKKTYQELVRNVIQKK